MDTESLTVLFTRGLAWAGLVALAIAGSKPPSRWMRCGLLIGAYGLAIVAGMFGAKGVSDLPIIILFPMGLGSVFSPEGPMLNDVGILLVTAYLAYLVFSVGYLAAKAEAAQGFWVLFAILLLMNIIGCYQSQRDAHSSSGHEQKAEIIDISVVPAGFNRFSRSIEGR